MTGIDKWVEVIVLRLFKENSYYAENEVKGSSVRTGVNCSFVLVC